jgi:hypothetical protein
MKIINTSKALITFIVLGASSLAFISTPRANTGKDIGTSNYRAACIKKQVQMHEKLKNVPAEAFHPFCDCTSKFLLNTLSPSQLSELSKGDKKPSWLPAVEKSAAEACLAPMPKLQV